MNGMPRTLVREASLILLLAAVYTLVGHLGLHQILTGDWPWLIAWFPAGIGAGAVLAGGYRYLVGVSLGAFLVPFFAGLPLASCLLETSAFTTEAFMLAWLVRLGGGLPKQLASLRESLTFMGAAALAPIPAASLAVPAYLLAARVRTEATGIMWVDWWWGDLLGLLLVVPFMVAWRRGFPRGLTAARCSELIALWVTAIAVDQFVFSQWVNLGTRHEPLAFAPFPLVIWGAMRFGQHGASLMSLTVGISAILGTTMGSGPFGYLPARTGFWIVEVFLFVLAVTGLLLAAVRAELTQALERRQSILDSMAEGLLVLDPGQQIVSANRSAEQILGRSASRMVGHSGRDVLGPFCPLAPAHQVLLDYRPNGHRLRQLRCNRVDLADGSALITFRDVTQEEEVNRLKSEFVSLASHELRTPLAIIKGYLDILGGSAAMHMGPDRQADILSRVRSQTNRLVQMVEDLLNVARLEEGKVVPAVQPTDIGEIVLKTAQELMPLAEAKGILVHVHVSPAGVPMAAADPQMVGHMLASLLDNAIKYSLEAGPIDVALESTGRFVRVTVADRGVGIPPSEVPQVFEKFHRVPNALMLKERGTGLGLYIARKMAELQGGMLIVSSVPEGGTTFALTLPVASPAGSPVPNGVRQPL